MAFDRHLPLAPTHTSLMRQSNFQSPSFPDTLILRWQYSTESGLFSDCLINAYTLYALHFTVLHWIVYALTKQIHPGAAKWVHEYQMRLYSFEHQTFNFYLENPTVRRPAARNGSDSMRKKTHTYMQALKVIIVVFVKITI